MNCPRAREIFPELLDPRTPPTAHLEARGHLASCPDCQREFAALMQTIHALDSMPTPQPSPRLRQNFYSMLEEEKHSAASVRVVATREHQARQLAFWRWVLAPLGSCALLVAGFLVGRHSFAPVDDGLKREIAGLQSRLTHQDEQLTKQNAQIAKMTTLVGYSIIQQQQNPANERLNEVLVAASSEHPSDKTLDDLLQALMLDPSVNVRLRAVEALTAHSERDVVRAGVLTALPREQNPLVQLELIDFIAEAQDRSAAPVLEKISTDNAADNAVREAAKRALAQL